MDSVPSSLKQGARAALSAKEELGAAALPSWRPCALGLALLGRMYRTVDSDPVAAQWAAQANVRSAIEELGRSQGRSPGTAGPAAGPGCIEQRPHTRRGPALARMEWGPWAQAAPSCPRQPSPAW